jgi:hypothetical protein
MQSFGSNGIGLLAVALLKQRHHLLAFWLPG